MKAPSVLIVRIAGVAADRRRPCPCRQAQKLAHLLAAQVFFMPCEKHRSIDGDADHGEAQTRKTISARPSPITGPHAWVPRSIGLLCAFDGRNAQVKSLAGHMAPVEQPRYAGLSSRGEEALVMTEPGDHMAAAAGGSGRLRASHADREQVIEVLKAAFVQGRLDKGELDVRVGQAFASRTYAELAALTDDIPVARPPRQPARGQDRSSRSHPMRNGAIASGVGLIVAVAAVGGAIILDDQAAEALLVLAAFIVLVVVPGVMLAAVAQAWEQRRSRGQLPPRPGQDGRAREVQQPGEAGHNPALPGDCPDQTRADLRTHRSRPSRPHSSVRVARAPRSIRPVPGAV